MSKIKNFLQYVKEALDTPEVKEVTQPEFDPNELVRFKNISKNFIKILTPLEKELVIAQILMKLNTGIEIGALVKEPVDFIDIDDDGQLSFLKPRFFEEDDKWKSSKRTHMKITRCLDLIFNKEYLNKTVKQTDVGDFANKWDVLMKNKARVVEYRGDDVLIAYNYTKMLDPNFGSSCANFHQREFRFGGFNEPTVPEYDIYTKNPENCGVAVVIEDGKIKARRSFQQGPNVITEGYYKKGVVNTVWGNYYGVGGRGSKYDILIKDYLKKKYDAAEMRERNGVFLISMETRFENYCPFDSMYVSFEHNLLSDNYRVPGYDGPFNDTYHAHCPEKFVKKRIAEEKAKQNANVAQNPQ